MFRKVNNDCDQQHLQNDLDKLVKWSKKWLLLFNVGKFKCLHTGHGNLDINYDMGDTVLGTTVTEKGLWKFQSSVVLQLQRVIKFLS